MKGRHILSVSDLSSQEIRSLLDMAIAIKASETRPSIAGATVALVFEKPSLRTRVSFEVAIHQLDGYAIYLSRDQIGLGNREPIEDTVKVLSRYVDALVIRTFEQATLEEMAQYSTIPVVNALSDVEHPCQALGDLLTIIEKYGSLEKVTLAYIGDGNNVAASLALAATSVGMNFRIASPPGYELPESVLQPARRFAEKSGASLACMESPEEAVSGSDVVYTDVWTSMGWEQEGDIRRKAFEGYQVNTSLLSRASSNALLLHPMPAHYGEEVPLGFLNHPQSGAYQQAENRLHIQKALLATILTS